MPTKVTPHALATKVRSAELCVGGLVSSATVLTVVGVLAAFLPLGGVWQDILRAICVTAFAAVAGFALLVSNQAAAAAHHVLTRRRQFRATFWIALACAVICGTTSVIGVHVGWTLVAVNAAPDLFGLPPVWAVDIAGGALAFTKPAMSWVIEGRRAIERLDREEAEGEERLHRRAVAAEERAARRRALERQQDADPGQRGATARALGPKVKESPRLRAFEVGAVAPAAAPCGATTAAPSPPRSTEASPPRDDALARRLIENGASAHGVSKQSGLPLTTAKRWIKVARARRTAT